MKYSLLILFFGISIAVTLSATADADSFHDRCPDIASCAKTMSELLGQKYLFDTDIKGQIASTPNVDIQRDNAEALFTEMLNTNGLMRVPAPGQANTWLIMRQRDGRDSGLPTISCDSQYPPRLPETWDWMTMQYKTPNVESIEPIARMIRSFLPANARIITAELSGSLLITANAVDLKRVYALIKENDRKLTPELKKLIEEREKMAIEARKANSATASTAPTSVVPSAGGK